MALDLLELLDAITDARVANPQMKASVQAALRLASGAGCLASGRLLVLRFDGGVREIVAQGEPIQAATQAGIGIARFQAAEGQPVQAAFRQAIDAGG